MPASTLTVNDLLARSLREIGVIRRNQTPTASMLTRAIPKLNSMVDDWLEDGIELNWIPVTAGSTVLPIQQKDERGLVYNFAIELAGEYGAPIPLTVQAIAERTFARFEKSTTELVESDLSHIPGVRSHGRYNINDG